MNISEKKKQFNEWRRLSKLLRSKRHYVFNLETQICSIEYAIFPERIQLRQGFFKQKPTDFIVPADWGKTDPCTVTIYRNAVNDAWVDEIFNMGTDDDIKTFCCPHFSKDAPCNRECQYREKNNRYQQLIEKLSIANPEYETALAERRAAWQKLIGHNK
ncbi:MAG: hypothetical protein J6T57_01030 [Alphaproteobacteria bacterium]|nr:hypothetical protein [Alphaproteobacteria bacterium]